MAVKIQTIKDIRFYIASELGEVYDDTEIRILSDMLIKTVTGITKLHQLYDNEYPVDSGRADRIVEFALELKKGKPVQYVLGETSFYNCTIRLNESTLIPRPETEELVDLIIRENEGYKGSIIDFGTGSGCIAISLALNLPGTTVTATDISEEALSMASGNALLNNARVTFVRHNMMNSGDELGRAGIIVSNPPYVRNSEKLLMKRNVLDFEPHGALFVSDSDPLVYYRAILKAAENILLPGGHVYFEINENLAAIMSQLLEYSGYSEIKIISDMNGKDRIMKGTKNVR